MPKTKEATQTMTFGKDEFGKEILYKDSNLPVMMEWEKPYIEACIEALNPTGNVLEIGFGLGYASKKIQQYHPKSHTIIESDPAVIEKAKKWAKDFDKVKIVEGKWQDILPTLGQFDAIFFDDYTPYNQKEIDSIMQNNPKLQNIADEAETVRDEIAEVLKSYKGLKFTDEQLEQFKQHLLARPNISRKQVTNFLQTLTKQGNITEKQRETFSHKLLSDNLLLNDEDKSAINRINLKQLGSNFIDFTEQSLKSHMKPGATLSGYIGTPIITPNAFQEKILSRKDVSYTEKAIKVQVPKNCTYFQGNSALIIVLKKK